MFLSCFIYLMHSPLQSLFVTNVFHHPFGLTQSLSLLPFYKSFYLILHFFRFPLYLVVYIVYLLSLVSLCFPPLSLSLSPTRNTGNLMLGPDPLSNTLFHSFTLSSLMLYHPLACSISIFLWVKSPNSRYFSGFRLVRGP